jgi:aminoglycoside phosphotransferase (APT) family kinase protein
MSEDPQMPFATLDRSEIDAPLARRLVDSQFPQWSDLPITAVDSDGWDNRRFRLGSELTIRLPTGNWYAQQVEKEQRWLPVIAPQLPLPIPTRSRRAPRMTGSRTRGRCTAGSTARSPRTPGSAT